MLECTGDTVRLKVLWDAKTVANAVSPVDFGRLMRDDAALTELLSALVIYGFALVGDTPADIEATRQAAERVSHIQETLFGRMWAFTSDMARADTAYTNIELGAHNDNAYLQSPAGLQVGPVGLLFRPVIRDEAVIDTSHQLVFLPSSCDE